MPALSKKLKKLQEERPPSLWEGPSSSGPNGGITQSMLNNFLACRERFRVRYVLGLQPLDQFNKNLEYGSMWHMAEESLAANDPDPWAKLDIYTMELCEKYPLQQADIIHWHNICKVQFPIYREYWAEHEDVQNRQPLLQEEVFKIPYKLPSGRTVYLRGKFDSVDLINNGIWLQENKTKGDIDPVLMQRNLTFDLQTGLYLVALNEYCEWDEEVELPSNAKVAGVRYNVIRRPLAGGKGSIRQKKNQTLQEFYEELGNIMREAIGPEWGMPPGEHFFFMRWKVDFTPQDIERFKVQFLNPILEQLCDWWNWVEHLDCEVFGPPENDIHWRSPYGTYSPIQDGRATDLDEYLETGSTLGLRRAESLFKELA